MIERLFLDRIDTESRRTPITRQNELIVLILPNETKPTLPIRKTTISRTQLAPNLSVIEPTPEPTLDGPGLQNRTVPQRLFQT